MRTRLFALSLIFSAAMAITGCAKEEGVMEKAGKSIDEAAESAGDAAKDMKDEVEKAVED